MPSGGGSASPRSYGLDASSRPGRGVHSTERFPRPFRKPWAVASLTGMAARISVGAPVKVCTTGKRWWPVGAGTVREWCVRRPEGR